MPIASCVRLAVSLPNLRLLPGIPAERVGLKATVLPEFAVATAP